MNQCQVCGTVNRDGARFCTRCGQQLTAVAPPPAFSPPLSSPAKRPISPLILLGGGFLLILLLLGATWLLLTADPEDETIAQATEVVEPEFGTEAEPINTPDPRASATVENPTTGDVETPIPDTEDPPDTPTATPGPIKIPGTDLEIPRIADEEEIDLGREIADEVEAEFGVYNNAEQFNRVNRIAQAIVPHADRSHMPYTVTLLDTDEINAFAVPGGFLYVTRGMLDFVEDDDELAGVIGHEIAHVGRRHGAEQLEVIAVASATTRALLNLDPRLENVYDTDEGRFATDMTVILLMSGWSRENENEADEYGIRYMAAAGYDPEAVIRLFERMDDTFAGGEDDTLSRLLATHPPFPDRIANVERVIREYDL